ncbi:hypothetical protein CAL7716_009670 [Calothrix sp. PCC 7716]|mgnify:CR=1 FL=1|nr:hypothetical protein CAL7716_009670 [Calothrix sp. PCC 7716]
MSTNGGASYTVNDIVQSGTYKLLIGDTTYYKASEENFETSTKLFHNAFPNGFLWEVLEVYSAPPLITFKWRHWGHFEGKYKNYQPTGETIEIIGVSVAHVSEDLQLLSLEHYYDNTKFLDQLTKQNSLQKRFLNFITKIRRLPNNTFTVKSKTTKCPFVTFLQ